MMKFSLPPKNVCNYQLIEQINYLDEILPTFAAFERNLNFANFLAKGIVQRAVCQKLIKFRFHLVS